MSKAQTLADLVAQAAPLTWVATGDMDGAKKWEIEASAALALPDDGASPEAEHNHAEGFSCSVCTAEAVALRSKLKETERNWRIEQNDNRAMALVNVELITERDEALILCGRMATTLREMLEAKAINISWEEAAQEVLDAYQKRKPV